VVTLAFERIPYDHVLLPAEQEEAARIWEDMKGRPVTFDAEGKPIEWVNGSTIDRFHENIVHGNGYIMYGYTDLTIALRLHSGVIAPMKIRGVAVKFLKGQPRLDYGGEMGGNDVFYEHYMTRSGPYRAAITAFVFADAEILECIAKTGKSPEQAAGTTAPAADLPLHEPQEGNPFSKQAVEEAAAALVAAAGGVAPAKTDAASCILRVLVR
jgi:hypothetical protein